MKIQAGLWVSFLAKSEDLNMLLDDRPHWYTSVSPPWHVLHLGNIHWPVIWTIAAVCSSDVGSKYGCVIGSGFLTPAAPGKAGRGMPGRPSLLWMAVAETICAEDIDAMLWRALSFTVWSFIRHLGLKRRQNMSRISAINTCHSKKKMKTEFKQDKSGRIKCSQPWN